jgi:hypothetical protein
VPFAVFNAVILSTLRDLLMILFLALGSAWFALDIARRLRKETVTPSPATTPPAAPAVSATIRPVATPPPPAPVVQPEGIPPAHLAVITAAVHHLFRGRARLAGVTRANVPDSRWAHEGRRDIFISHRLR